MEDVGTFYGHLVYFMAIRHILRPIGISKVIWYILPVLVSCSKKNLATLFTTVYVQHVPTTTIAYDKLMR
jgi:hypothetical protein